MDHVAGPLHILLAEKEARIWFNIVCLKLYQFKRTTWWCLYVLEYITKFALQYILEFVLLKDKIKNQSWSLEICVSPPLGGGLDENSRRPWNLIHSPPCRTQRRLLIHESFFGPLGSHLRVWSELGRSSPFRPMRALRLQRSWAFGLVCEVKPYIRCPYPCPPMPMGFGWAWVGMGGIWLVILLVMLQFSNTWAQFE